MNIFYAFPFLPTLIKMDIYIKIVIAFVIFKQNYRLLEHIYSTLNYLNIHWFNYIKLNSVLVQNFIEMTRTKIQY